MSISTNNNESKNNNTQNANESDLILPNRPPPQQIPNTPFMFYPAPNSTNTNTNTNGANETKVSDSNVLSNNNNNKSNKKIIEIDFEASNKLIENNNKKNKMPYLSNDINSVIFEIDTLHDRIFHLRRTNKEIKEFYSDDIDCQIAYKENIEVINKNLKNLFVYFDLFKDLANGQRHRLEKLYETDRKVFEKYENIDNKSVEYMMPQSATQAKNEKNETNETDEKSNDKTGNNVSDNTKNSNNNEIDDNGMGIDDDGGLTL